MSDSPCRLDEHTIALHAGGDLGRLRRWLVDRHLARCPQCKAAVSEYSKVLDDLAQVRPVPEIDFDALAHNVRVAAAQSRPIRGTQTGWRWRAAAGVGLAAVVVGMLVLIPNSDDSEADPTLVATSIPAVPEQIGPWDGDDVQLTSTGSLRVQAFHSGSGALTITDYYAP
ncbi:MAG: hypothetical protein F4X12_11930 [Acidobacteriia bacterium]|nr:hypothetical protein [Terriglobia bacterium]